MNHGDSITQLEEFIDITYNTVNMAKHQRQQTLMDLLMSPISSDGVKHTSTPVASVTASDNKRKATSPLIMKTSNANVMDISMKTYLEDMTRNITEQISVSTTRLESLILNQGTDIQNLTRDKRPLGLTAHRL